MHPTPAILAAGYEFIRSVPPVRGWNLPPSDQVEFRVMRDRTVYGAHTTYAWKREHIIDISAANISHADTLLRALAHEMVHAACAVAGERTEHGEPFQRRARVLCRAMGWDERAF